MSENEKRVDWTAIKAEYIAGGIGQRKLAEKYGVSYSTLRGHSQSEGWVKDREDAQRKVIAKSTQKTAESAATNAVTAQRIRAKLLARLEREIDALPDSIGTNKRKAVTEYEYDTDRKGLRKDDRLKKQKYISAEYNLRDLTAAWKDLTEGLIITEKAEDITDDGFLNALKGTAIEDWTDGEENINIPV